MEKLEFTKRLGEKIIKSQHDYFETDESEDLEHITNLKRIIMAIAEYLKSKIDSEEEVDDLVPATHSGACRPPCMRYICQLRD